MFSLFYVCDFLNSSSFAFPSLTFFQVFSDNEFTSTVTMSD